MDIGTAEDGATWTAFSRPGVRRQAGDLRLPLGLKQAIAAVLDGASWQRCRTHFMRNLRRWSLGPSRLLRPCFEDEVEGSLGDSTEAGEAASGDDISDSRFAGLGTEGCVDLLRT